MSRSLNLSHLDDVINMRQLSIRSAFVSPVPDLPNKVKIDAELEGLPEGTWQPEDVTGKCEIVNLDTQEKTTIDLDWDSSSLLLAGYFTFPAVVAAVNSVLMQSLTVDGSQYGYTLIAYDNGNKTMVATPARERKLRIENVKIDPNPFATYMAPHKTKITADVVSDGFQLDPEQITWEVNIKDKDGEVIEHLPKDSAANKIKGTGGKIAIEWDGKGDAEDYQGKPITTYVNFDYATTKLNTKYRKYYEMGAYTVEISAEYSPKKLSASSSSKMVVEHYIVGGTIGVPEFSQIDPIWSEEILDDLYNETIGSRGCALCSFSMFAAWVYGDIEGNIRNPFNINIWLKSYEGYITVDDISSWKIIFPDWQKALGSLKWEKIREYTSNKYEFYAFVDISAISPISWKVLLHHDIFTEHHPDIVRCAPHHFVVAKGLVGDTFLLSDSARDIGRFRSRHFLEDYEGSEKPLDLLRFKAVTSPSGKSLAVHALDETGASVQYAIIDPQGRYLGYDPAKRIMVEEENVIQGDIPDAQYVYLPNTNFQTNEPEGFMKTLWLYRPTEGTYKLRVFGIDASEHYHIQVESDHPEEEGFSKIEGYIVPGQVTEYNVEFSQTTGQIPSVFVNAKLDIDPDMMNLKSKGEFITAYIELPQGLDVKDVKISTVYLQNEIPAFSHPTETVDHDGNGTKDLMVKFSRSAIIEYLKSKGITSGEITLKVTGKLFDVSFRSSDTIRVK